MRTSYIIPLHFILTPILLSILVAGCFYFGGDRYEDVLLKPSSEWSSREALTVIASAMATNYYDARTNIKIAATPFYPAVIAAINRSAPINGHWQDEKYREHIDALLSEHLGAYYDWSTHQLYDSRGNIVRDKLQIDSLTFLITISNKGWPCNSVMWVFSNSNIYSLKNPGDNPWVEPRLIPVVTPENCYVPDITTLEDRIFLVNAQNKFIKPIFVWGRRHNILTTTETLFAKFSLRHGEYHFLSKSDKISLLIKGFERDIVLEFPLSMLR